MLQWSTNQPPNTDEKARNLTKQADLDISIGHYLKNLSKLTTQFTQQNYKDATQQRLYMKDIDCPDAWREHLEGILPSGLFYLNESTAKTSGPGSASIQNGMTSSPPNGKGVAPAGDLMSSLPPPMRAENLMCYIGHEGTYTPAHREMCASLGHNIMVDASGDGLDLWDHPERPGSSIWFMTETKDRFVVSEYWLSILGHDIEVEAHFAQLNAWKNAPFTTHIVEQKPGDFILIPPLAPHQVWNRGTRTVKVAWNRTTVETLEKAMEEALPRARMVCRDEQYKNKAIVYYSLQKYSEQLGRVYLGMEDVTASALADIKADWKVRQLAKDFRRLFRLFTDLLLSESFSPNLPNEKQVQFLPFDSNVTCAYCRCNIFNRFLTCKTCIFTTEDGEEDAYDICMECYAMGRSCGCISNLKWVEQFKWASLLQKYADWTALIIEMDGGVNEETPPPFSTLRKRLSKKTLAHVCQEQLRLRPWRDINQPPPRRAEEQGRGDVEDGNGEDDRPSKRRKKSKSKKSNCGDQPCHICHYREYNWKLARCKCGTAYCYGTLFRAFDLMPQDIMENPDWQCPKCLEICSCGRCRKDPKMKPYKPVGTLVGHDTRRVADPRSVESLVDFGRSNLSWISKNPTEDDQGSQRQKYKTVQLQRLKEEADREKAREETLTESYVDDNEEESPNGTVGEMSQYTTDGNVAPGLPASRIFYEDGPSIDPLLLGGGKDSFLTPETQSDETGDQFLSFLRAETASLDSRLQPATPATDARVVNKVPVANMTREPASQSRPSLGFHS